MQNIVNPDLEIREGVEIVIIIAADGQFAGRFVTGQDEQFVVLRTTERVCLHFFREEIDEIQSIPQTVMQNCTLRDLTNQ